MTQEQQKLYLSDFNNNVDLNNAKLRCLDLEIIKTWLDMNFLRAISQYENHHIHYEHELLVPIYCTHAKEHMVAFKAHIETIKHNYGIDITLIKQEPVQGYKFIIYSIIFHFKADTTYSHLIQKRNPLIVDKYISFGSQEADFKRYIDGNDKDNLHFVNATNQKYIEKRLKEKQDYEDTRRKKEKENIDDALRDNHINKIRNEVFAESPHKAIKHIKRVYENTLLKSPELNKLKQKNDIHINVEIKPKKKQKLNL